MPIYDRPVRSLIQDMVHDLAPTPETILTRDSALAWFQRTYPKIRPTTVSAQLTMITTNIPSRVYYGPRAGGEDDLLFQVDRGQYRRYDAATDPAPIRRDAGSERVDLRAMLLPIVERVYPAWSGFDDPRFVGDEITYKRKAIADAAELLNRGELTTLVEQKHFDEVILRLEQVGKKGRNLLFLRVPSQGDLRILRAPNLDREGFCTAILDLLYGPGDSPDRLTRYLSYVTTAGLPNIWTFPTYFLFVCSPASDLYIKPTWIERFLKLIGRSELLSSVPSGESYGAILRIAGDLLETFSDHDPQDMVDIQSLMWVCAANAVESVSKWLEVDPKRIETRKELEGHACRLIESHLGRFDEQTLREFLRYVNTDWSDGKTHYNRFGTTFGTPLVTMMVEHLDELNLWTERIWKEDPETIGPVLNEFWRTSPVKGADRGYSSVLLYLRDPERYAVWLDALIRGLSAFTRSRPVAFKPTNAKTYAEYEQYLAAVRWFRAEHEIPPQAVDLVLWRAWEQDEKDWPPIEPPDPIINPASSFTARAFDLLAQLHRNPVKATYLDRKEEFRTHLEEPFERLLRDVAGRLPEPILERLETGQKTIARILKNDYGKGGAWDFYWGAFYPKGGKRTEDAQLYIWMNEDRLEYGFYIGEYGSQSRHRFLNACKQHQDLLQSILPLNISGIDEHRFGRRDGFVGGDSLSVGQRMYTFSEWLRSPGEAGVQVAKVHFRKDILGMGADTLVASIVDTFKDLYPLVLLAAAEQPVAEIKKWFGIDPIDHQPSVPPRPVCRGHRLDPDELKYWVETIERKGQIILYGPPGTGKMYMATHLAKHLIGEGDGFTSIVQFHPAYSYEDFIEGIRPQLTEKGELDYRMERGRFLTFCDAAVEREGTCVLIIDEINRANLARVFGELMHVLEYRNTSMPLAGGGALKVPSNVMIIGTMNTADRSIALVDHALRRRFAFLELRPDYEVLKRFHQRSNSGFPIDRLIAQLKGLNREINDPHYEVGISYFMCNDLDRSLRGIWRTEIEPYIREHFYDQPRKAEEFSWESVKGGITA